MIVIERTIARVLRYRKVYLPSAAQLADLVNDLRPLDLLRVFWPAVIISHPFSPVFQSSGTTIFVDLSQGLEAMFQGMHASCRYKVRRAEKMRDRFEIVMNTEAARSDFAPLYNKFARKKKTLPLLTARRFNEIRQYSDIFMLYFDGRPTCGRLVVRDEETRTALMTYSATSRLEPGADGVAIGLLNRYLYWHEMKTYQVAGLDKYDFAGAGENPSLVQFKLSFGGVVSTFSYCFYAGTAPIFWKLMHSLYQLQHYRRVPRIPGRQPAPVVDFAIGMSKARPEV
jgi:hypothetical protein